MKNLDFGRHALGVCVGAAILAGCGGHASDGVVPMNATPNSLPYHKTFHYTGAEQDFKVPAGVRQLNVIALGAHGAGVTEAYGGRVHAVIPVTPREKLEVYVGGDGSGTTGGFNGGGSSGPGVYGGTYGYGGGGESDVREDGNTFGDRTVVAGGGGGQGEEADGYGCRTPVGGSGGERTGGNGTGGPASYAQCGQGAGGGTQSAGGSGGAAGTKCFGHYGNAGQRGGLGTGGSGGTGSPSGSFAGAGGGGGGGYYGSGGGGAGCSQSYGILADGGGGGGGSSYAESSATDVRMWQGWKESAGNGLVVFSWYRE